MLNNSTQMEKLNKYGHQFSYYLGVKHRTFQISQDFTHHRYLKKSTKKSVCFDSNDKLKRKGKRKKRKKETKKH
jgi:hypothetical protein